MRLDHAALAAAALALVGGGCVALALALRRRTPAGFEGLRGIDDLRDRLQDTPAPRGSTVTAPIALDGVGAGKMILTHLAGPRRVRTPRGGRANVRFGPGISMPAIYHVLDGSRVQARDFRQSVDGSLWVRIETLDGASGWIRGDMVEEVEA